MKNIPSKALYGDESEPSDFKFRPRVSADIRAYLIDIVQRNILIPKKIISTDKSEYRFTFAFSTRLSYKENDSISWTLRTRDGIKVIAIYMYYQGVTDTMNSIEYTNTLFDGLTTFLTEQYKKISVEEMEAVRSQIDFDYINHLPFPAPFYEQKYIVDANPNVEMAYRQQFGE